MSKKFIVLTVTIIVAFAALWQTNRVASQIRDSEASKIRLWASAISQKAQLVNTTEQFFLQVGILVGIDAVPYGELALRAATGAGQGFISRL